MTQTARIVELLQILADRGHWTDEEMEEAKEIIMGRDPAYIPEGTEDWMQDDDTPRHYDKPKRYTVPPEVMDRLTPEERDGPLKALGLTPDEVEALRGKPKPFTTESAKAFLAQSDKPLPDRAVVGQDGVELEKRLQALEASVKTAEAALTDAFRRIKALEERLIDPSA